MAQTAGGTTVAASTHLARRRSRDNADKINAERHGGCGGNWHRSGDDLCAIVPAPPDVEEYLIAASCV